MPTASHVNPRSGDVLVLVGTMKGAFILRAERRAEHLGGGRAVLSRQRRLRDGLRRPRRPHRALGRARTACTGAGCCARATTSAGPGRTPRRRTSSFRKAPARRSKQIWQIVPGRESEPDTLYCGVEPAALFVSRDAGATWSLVEGLWNHPQRPRWQPGGGGLCLHTILLDPERPESHARSPCRPAACT